MMEQKKQKLERAAAISYICVAAMFVLVFLYMDLFESNSVYAARENRSCTVVDNYAVREIEDAQAPAGIRREYSWKLDNFGTNENSLGFYLVHQYAQVYFDDQLIYSLMPGEDNKICRGVSSNWVMIPIYPEDSGKEVRVVVTSAYRNVADYNVEFSVGSRYSIYFNQLKSDLVQLILSGLCIAIGGIVMLVQLGLVLQKKTRTWDMFWLGNFSAILGLWKITDTRFSPLMFNGNPLVLGYVTIGMLFLGVIPLLFFEKGHLPSDDGVPVTVEILTFCAVACAVMLCQLFGIAEFKQTLVVSHILIVLAMLTSLWMISRRRHARGVPQRRAGVLYILLMILGALADIVSYYVNKSSVNVIYTLLAFLICVVIAFTKSILDINRRAKTDAQTGFFNKSRWNQLMNEKPSGAESIGILMLDLNRLKYINDTMGHEVGDKMILSFSNILRNSIPHSNTICRWGGDEFTVMVTDASREKMEGCLADIRAAVEAYNASGEKPEIYYAAGYALSSEFPGITRKELTQRADEQMYRDKKRWYRENLNTNYHTPA